MRSIKKYIVALLLFNGLSIVAQDKLPLHFTDNFENNVNRWYQVTEYGDRVYHNALYVNPKKDFRLVAEFNSQNQKGEAKWGLSWGRKDAYKFYHFEINHRQEFRVGYQKDGDFNVVEPWTRKNKIIDSEYNILEIRKKGTTLQLLINEKVVYKMAFREFEYSGVALRSSSTAIQFKRFSIYQDMGKINLVEGGDFATETVPKNLGQKVNSHYVDKSPSISPDGKTLYFIREDAQGGFGGQDIYFSERLDDVTWSTAKNIGRPLNNQANNFVNAVMPDNNTLMTINSYGRSSMDEVLAFTYRTKDGWSLPRTKSIRK